jgi:hypothetical protein
MFQTSWDVSTLKNVIVHQDLQGWYMVFNAAFSYIMAVSFIGRGNWSTRRKPPTCRKPLTNFIITCCIEYTSPWSGFELTTLVVIDTYCIGSYKSNYYMITTPPPKTYSVHLRSISISTKWLSNLTFFIINNFKKVIDILVQIQLR